MPLRNKNKCISCQEVTNLTTGEDATWKKIIKNRERAWEISFWNCSCLYYNYWLRSTWGGDWLQKHWKKILFWKALQPKEEKLNGKWRMWIILKWLLPSMVCCWLSRAIASCLLRANSFHRKLHSENCSLSRTDTCVYSLGWVSKEKWSCKWAFGKRRWGNYEY